MKRRESCELLHSDFLVALSTTDILKSRRYRTHPKKVDNPARDGKDRWNGERSDAPDTGGDYTSCCVWPHRLCVVVHVALRQKVYGDCVEQMA
jgi:hypothetical protein